jgi:hypothetical protein
LDGKLAATWKSDLTRDQFLTAYHHRRTSSCLGARFQLRVGEIDQLSRRLLEPGVIDEMRDRGFATVVVHHPSGRAFERRYASEIARMARSSEGRLVPIAASESMTAYALRPAR